MLHRQHTGCSLNDTKADLKPVVVFDHFLELNFQKSMNVVYNIKSHFNRLSYIEFQKISKGGGLEKAALSLLPTPHLHIFINKIT